MTLFCAKKGVQSIDYFHPDLQACLEPTYGVIVYQEQVMQIAQIIGGYTLGGADLLRRAMGKKKPEEMAQHRDIFVKGAINKGYALELANKLFDLMAMFAEYGFNKSHTAAYAVVTYQTAWLKAHYPAEFMAATLSSDMDDTDKVQLFVSDTKHNGVQLLAPDVHASAWRFEPVYEAGKAAIRYGLGAVKGAGEAAVKHLLAARSQGRFKHLFDLCKRVDRRIVNRRTLEAMIRAGALDEIEHDRARAFASVGLAMDEAEKSLASLGQESLFAEAFGQEPDQSTEMHYLKVPSWSERQRLQEEKLALGFFLSGHLFHAYASEVRRFAKTPLAQIHPAPQGQWVAGIVTALRTQMTRRGKMLFISLDDSSATLEAAVFAESIDKHRQILKVDDLLIVYGKVSRDDYSGGQRLVVDRMLDLSGARAEFARSLRLELNAQADAIRLKKALTLFSAPEGQQGCSVVVRYHNNNASCELKLPPHCKVRPDDALLALIQSEFQGSQAEVVYN